MKILILKKQQYLQHRTDERILFLKYIDDLICAKKYGYNTIEPKKTLKSIEVNF